MEILDFGSGSHMFEHAGVTALGGEWIVAGIEIDAALDPTTDEDTGQRRLRILQHNIGEIQPPPRDSELPMELPVPVALSDTEWGLVWAEAEPTPGYEGSWIPTFFTRLWLAEYVAGRWQAPRKILSTSLKMSWETNRTIISDRQRGTLIMVVGEDPGVRHIMFGDVSVPLKRINLPGDLSPKAATFLIDEDGAVTVIAHVVPSRAPENNGSLVMMRLLNDSTPGAVVDTIALPEGDIARLRAHRDIGGTLHVLWTDQDREFHHIARMAKQPDWKASVVPPPSGALVNWVSGIDRYGRVVITTQLMYASTGHDFELTRWEGRWSPFREAFPDFLGVSLFDGISQAGEWYVGWSGTRKEQAKSGTLKAWLTMP